MAAYACVGDAGSRRGLAWQVVVWSDKENAKVCLPTLRLLAYYLRALRMRYAWVTHACLGTRRGLAWASVLGGC